MSENLYLHCSSSSEPSYSLIFLLMIPGVVVGLPGNLLALWIFCFRMKSWEPHVVFLFNLMLADFLLLVCVPFRIDTHLRGEHWVYGEAFCRINLFMLAVNRSASIGFMTAVALNRYFKVLHPLCRVSFMTLRHAVWLSLFIWATVAALRIPLLTTNLLHRQGNCSMCRSFGGDLSQPAIIVHTAAYIAEFLLPWALLLFCSARIVWYLKQKGQMVQKKNVKKAIRAMTVINLVFTVCFLPAIVTGLGALAFKTFGSDNCAGFRRLSLAFMASIGFSYLNSALDPLIYTFSSSMFRAALKGVFRRSANV
uniref:Hydroxycarboxylic acid receptor 1-3 n=1 Tax=Neogobius melanostomus TaxID=47308 RepID=A0A8C6SKB9_9GOBI